MGKRERRGSIERKILRTILWVGITPIALALAIGYLVVHEAQRKAVQRTLEVAAQKTVSGVLFALDSRLRTVRALSQDAEVISFLSQPVAERTPESVQSLAERLKKVHGYRVEDGPSTYSMFDAEGQYVLSTSPLFFLDRYHGEWIDRVDHPRFMSFQFRPEQNGYYARIVAPVHSPKTGQLLGFFAEDQGVTTLINYVLGGFGGEDQFGPDVYQIALVGRNGGVQMQYLDTSATPPIKQEGPDRRLQARLADADSAPTGSMRIATYHTEGEVRDVLLTYHRLDIPGGEEDFRLYLVVYRPASAAFSTINAWALFTILGGALLITLFCILAYRHVHNNIVRPLALLNEGAQIIRQGDLELKLKIATGDEIEELATSFNKMALALNHNLRQLAESEEKYRSLINSMRDGVCQTDTEGVLTFVNPAGADILGFESPDEAVGQQLRSFFMEEIDFARVASQFRKNSYIQGMRIWMKRIDHRAICVELSGNTIYDEAGNPVGAEGIVRDVTASVRLEQQVRERAERISAINQIANVINSSLEAGRLHESLIAELKKLVHFDCVSVALLDEEGGAFHTRYLWPESVAGSWQRLPLAPADSCAGWVTREQRCLMVNDLAHDPPAFAREFPDGTMSCLCVPLYATGRIIGTLNLGSNTPAAFSRHDVEGLEEMAPHIAVALRNARLLENLQHSLEEVTRAREKLHEANEELKTLDEMKTNLLSNVSHELRTPLVAVMGYTDMIFNSKVGPVNEVQAEYLGIIMRNVEKLVTLIENLLDFSRLHRGAERLVFAPFDLIECARASMQTVQPVADSRDIRLELISSEDQVNVEGDRGKMGQVFNNLLSNAVKFNRNSGQVTVEIRKREDSVEVAVSDTGIGIPAEALDKVFTRFYQYDSSSTRKYGGTGIGLSIAQDIVRLHGSRITVTSELGQGTVFRFNLPIRATHSEAAGTDLPVVGETNLLLELITQDRALNVHLRNLLTPEGMDVVHAADSEYAITLAHRHHPDCILVDLPEGNGGTVELDRLLADPVTASVPVVIFTNDDRLYDRYRTRIGARMRRSFRKSVLLSSIHYALTQGVVSGEPLGGKILCVDDDPEVIGLITRVLRNEGFEVDACSSGQEALSRVMSREYRLVLLDIAMPGLDGWEVCRRIRSESALAGVKVYFVTAKPVDRRPQRVKEVGGDGYLVKPFRPDELIELAREIAKPSGASNA